MSNRDTAIRLIKQMPANASLKSMARQLEFVAGLNEGLAQSERREGKSIAEVRKLIRAWTRPAKLSSSLKKTPVRKSSTPARAKNL